LLLFHILPLVLVVHGTMPPTSTYAGLADHFGQLSETSSLVGIRMGRSPLAAIDDTAIAEGDTGSAEHLSPAEITAAIDSLDEAAKLKLGKIAKFLAGGTDMSPTDLIHEALCRAMLRQRRCPRGTPFIAFVAKTMQSIAYHAREKQKLHTQLPANETELDSVALVYEGSRTNPTPEQLLLENEAKDTVKTILGHFEDDEEAQLVILGWTGDRKGKELREYVGVDQPTLDYAIKRISRRMAKLYPNGWTS
jgi:DNA-directed RNA polymerase specialized sigma24 family protein